MMILFLAKLLASNVAVSSPHVRQEMVVLNQKLHTEAVNEDGVKSELEKILLDLKKRVHEMLKQNRHLEAMEMVSGQISASEALNNHEYTSELKKLYLYISSEISVKAIEKNLKEGLYDFHGQVVFVGESYNPQSIDVHASATSALLRYAQKKTGKSGHRMSVSLPKNSTVLVSYTVKSERKTLFVVQVLCSHYEYSVDGVVHEVSLNLHDLPNFH